MIGGRVVWGIVRFIMSIFDQSNVFNMNIFIAVYHMIRDVICFPVTIARKLKNRRLKRQTLKESGPSRIMQETIANSTSFEGNNAEAILADVNSDDRVSKSDLLTFHYVVKNDYGHGVYS